MGFVGRYNGVAPAKATWNDDRRRLLPSDARPCPEAVFTHFADPIATLHANLYLPKANARCIVGAQ